MTEPRQLEIIEPGPSHNGYKLLDDGREIFWQDSKCHGIGPYRVICARRMRGNRICIMPKDHKGRCSSVGFQCDGCGHFRRGSVYAWGQDGEYDHGMAFCFLCASPQVNGSLYDYAP